MTKNTIGGKGHKKSKKLVSSVVKCPFKESGTDYAYVTNLLGNGWLRVYCLGDNIERLGHIRGSMYKKVWIAKDDLVLVSLRDFQTDRCDVLYKYESHDVSFLRRNGHIPENSEHKTNTHNFDESNIMFGDIGNTAQLGDIEIDDI